jgi:hypothetical protein
MQMRLIVPSVADFGRSEQDWEKRWEKNWQILMDVLYEEDFPLLRASQLALQSADTGGMLIGRNEVVNQIFHRETWRLLGAGS